MLALGIAINVFVGGSATLRNVRLSVCQWNLLAEGKRIPMFRKRNTKNLQRFMV
jgi:hypothetical protein